MLKSLKNKKLMVVVAHPDDEILGLGASLHKLCRDYNCQVRVVILGEGLTSRSEVRDVQHWKKDLKIHRNNIKSAQKVIGYQSLSLYDFPDNRFDTVAILDLIKVVEKEKNDFLPDFIFTHHSRDLNVDHQRTYDAVITATRPLANQKTIGILTFETPSSTEWNAYRAENLFIPNLFVEISEANLKAKIKAMEFYTFEKRKSPHPRSPQALTALAQYRGSNCGHKLAEAYSLQRLII